MNILLITTIYPLPIKENRGTSVCHYFTKEWIKQGHSVRVVHFQAIYPFFYYWMAKIAREYISSKTGAVVYTFRDKGDSYEQDGVHIDRIPLYKYIPHGKFSAKSINDALDKIVHKFKSISFTPDVILGHFPNPQIEVVSLLKDIYPKALSGIVLHDSISSIEPIYGKRYSSLSSNIDVWGFRSISLKEQFENQFGKLAYSFICYSGIPSHYITTNNTHSFSGPMRRFLFVGELIERKYPDVIIDALLDAYPNRDFSLSYIGSGKLAQKIVNKIKDNNLGKQVSLYGNIPRDEIRFKYDESDCMIMISSGEAYGLVYLEAMSRGCIPIASRNEGFDGIIVDGVNGFLCEAGNSMELCEIINKINLLSPEKRQEISENAIKTSKSLTDSEVAKKYLEDLFNCAKA